MNRSSLLSTYTVLLSCLFSALTVSANPCSNPKRVVAGYTVDLQPLMTWWSERKGVRPLSAWKHVRGTLVREAALGWIIVGKVEGQGECTFFLKNPPRDRLRRYQELQSQLPQYQRAQAATQEYLQRPVCTDWYSYVVTPWQSAPISMTEYRQASAVLADTTQKSNALSEELATLQDEKGNFTVDLFALKLNETYQGLTVFDHGSVEAFRFARAAD